MVKELSVLRVGESLNCQSLQEKLEKNNIKLSWQQIEENAEVCTIEAEAGKNHISLLDGPQSLQMYKVVNHRSVGSHFLNYVDFIETRDKKIWGDSVFSSSFLECLLRAMKNQDYKGSVIFLGEHPKVLPTLEVLAKFGFEDFDFLELSAERPIFDHVKKYSSGLLNTKVSSVESAAFIRSQKEYSLCFVLYDQYIQQILEDMSYFHFLSQQSMVFDFSGQSNFLFAEVKALGVSVFEYSDLEEVHEKKLEQKILEYAKKTGD